MVYLDTPVQLKLPPLPLPPGGPPQPPTPPAAPGFAIADGNRWYAIAQEYVLEDTTTYAQADARCRLLAWQIRTEPGPDEGIFIRTRLQSITSQSSIDPRPAAVSVCRVSRPIHRASLHLRPARTPHTPSALTQLLLNEPPSNTRAAPRAAAPSRCTSGGGGGASGAGGSAGSLGHSRC